MLNNKNDISVIMKFPSLINVASKATRKELLTSAPSFIQHITHPTQDEQNIVINNDPHNITLIADPTTDSYKLALVKDLGVLNDINPPEEILEYAASLYADKMITASKMTRWEIIKLILNKALFNKTLWYRQ